MITLKDPKCSTVQYICSCIDDVNSVNQRELMTVQMGF